MFEPCVCGTGGKNTGQPSCIPIIERTAKIILVKTFANDGTRNSVKKSDFVNGVLPDTFIQSQINQVDTSKRWYVTPKINAVVDTRAEPVTFDVDGIPKIIDQGVRTFVGSFYDKLGSPTFAGVLNSFNCQDISYFEISVNGDIVGMDNGVEMLPIAIETGSFYAGVVRGTKAELNSVSLTFAVNELEKDENLIQIGASQVVTKMLNTRGLIDVVGEGLSIPAITSTKVRIDLGFIYGAYNNAVPFEGLAIADLSIFNTTLSVAPTLTSVVAVVGATGQYDVVISTGASSTNVMTVSLSKVGFEMKPFTYLIP